MKLYLTITILLAYQFGFTQTGKTSFTLSEAQAFAIENHLSVKNAELEYEESKKKVQETAAQGLPQLSLAANYRYFIDIPKTVVDARALDPNAPSGETIAVEFGQNNNASASITATQLIFDGTFFVGLRAANAYKELKNQSIYKSEIEVKDMVARSYYNTLIAEANKEVVDENVERLVTQKKELSQMYISGFIEEIEVDQIDLILTDAQSRQQTVIRQIGVMYQLLNFQMGRDLNAPLTLSENLSKIYGSYDEDALLNNTIIVEDHIDFKLMETQEKLRLLQIKSDKVSRLPKVGAIYNHGQDSYVNPLQENTWYRSSFVGLSLSMPIFTSSMNHSKLQQSKIQLSKLQNDKRMLSNNLKIEVSIARATYLDALQKYEVEEKNLKTSKKIFEITTTKQKNGLASSMEVTVASNQYVDTQGKYINALYRILEAKANLDKALNKY